MDKISGKPYEYECYLILNSTFIKFPGKRRNISTISSTEHDEIILTKTNPSLKCVRKGAKWSFGQNTEHVLSFTRGKIFGEER